MQQNESSPHENPCIRYAAERGDEVIAHYAVHVMRTYADDVENSSFMSSPPILADEIISVVRDLILLAEYARLDWQYLLGRAEEHADEERLIGAEEQFPATQDNAE